MDKKLKSESLETIFLFSHLVLDFAKGRFLVMLDVLYLWIQVFTWNKAAFDSQQQKTENSKWFKQ